MTPPDSQRVSGYRIAASVVSHGQTTLVNQLLIDLAERDDGAIALLVLTLNLPGEDIPECYDRYWKSRGMLIRNPTAQGFGANHNAAFNAALGSVSTQEREHWLWAVLNPDLRLMEAGVFARLADAFVPGVDLVAPGVIESGQIAPSARGLYTPVQAVKGFTGLGRTLKNPPDWLAGMFLMIRASTYQSLGGFDPRYFMYCEDVDLCLRVQLHGGKIRYEDSVRVVHEAQRASHKSGRALAIHLASACKLWTSRAFWSFLLRRNKA